MHKLGFVIADLSASQQSFFLINYVNQAVLLEGHDITVFFQTPRIPCIQTGFGLMHMHEAYGFDGPLISTNLNTANRVAKFPGTSEKYFYVWDLEWMRIPNKTFQAMSAVYRNPAHKLIARSNEHSRIIEDCWNTSVVGVVNNFNIKEFIEIINGERNKQGISGA